MVGVYHKDVCVPPVLNPPIDAELLIGDCSACIDRLYGIVRWAA